MIGVAIERKVCALMDAPSPIVIFALIVKDSGMRVEEVEKKGGKEDGSPTMPLMLFSFYRVIRSWRKGRDFFARLEYKQDGIPSCRGCGHKKVVFYDHYYRKAKVASIDGRIYDVIIKARRYRCVNRLALRVFCLRQNLIRASLELQSCPRRSKME